MSPTTSIQLPMDDAISYKIFVAKAVPVADVTITAHLTLMVSNRDESQDTDNRIRSALTDFIDTEWTILTPERSSATPGFERINVKAIAKISSTENRNLDERAARANREGLEFDHVRVNRTLPQEQANQIIKELWFEAVEKVTAHLADFNRVSRRQWRIGDVALGAPGTGRTSRRLNKGGYQEELDEPLTELMESCLTGVEKISLTADVTLRSIRINA
jgi:hypothetical protein